jgi:aldose 1-epimerase
VRTPPTGEQVELRHGAQTAVVVEVGGGLRSYEIDGRAIVDGYAADRIPSGGRGQVLIPWPNRIADGRYEWDGKVLQLDLSEPSVSNAIHGLTRWVNWIARERSPSRVVMTLVLHPSPGYPFALAVDITYELGEEGLSVTTRTTNIGGDACPYGVGFHPYLSAPGSELIDVCELELPAATSLVANDRSIPRSSEPVDGTPYDFRTSRPIGNLVLDTCFADVGRDSDGIARIVLSGPPGGGATTLWLDAAYPYLMAYSGDTLPVAERRRGLAVEPMSCAPNAFQSGDGLARLEPGEVHLARWGISAA